MNAELATVVTGDPRTGTALLMRTLDLLGAPVSGQKFGFFNDKPDGDETKELLEKAAQGLNPKGFYELTGVVMSGFQKLTGATIGRAVKVMAVACYPRETINGVAMGTPADLVDRYILCIRHPRHIAQSQTGLLGLGMQAGEDGWELTKHPLSPEPYLRRMAGFCDWLGQQDDETFNRFLPIDFVETLTNPADTIDKVIDHLSLDVKWHQRTRSIDNIDPKLQRSNEFHTWPVELEHSGQIADSIYDALKEMDRGKIQAAALWAVDWLLELRHEGAVWCDDADTWATIKPKTARRIMQNDRGLADTMRTALTKYRRNGYIQDQCAFYSRDPEKTYTIVRPLDLGNLTRSMVFCNRDDVHRTVEACKFCWQHGSILNGNVKGPQRIRP